VEPEERLTKRERRERSREQRKHQETRKVKESQQRRWLTITGVAVGIVGVAALIWFAREAPAPSDIIVVAGQAEEAAEAAGCIDPGVPPPTTVVHIDPAGAPEPADLYPVRPTHAGPHFANWSSVAVFDSPQDERLLVHNLEHGAVIVWYDPDLIDRSDVRELEQWAQNRNRAGFLGRSGSGVIVSPYADPLDSGKAIAFRAWLVAVDCDSFEEPFADAFLAQHFGTRGLAPERALGPYPDGVVELEGTPQLPGEPAIPADPGETGMDDGEDDEDDDES
jgi:hypothetical protein